MASARPPLLRAQRRHRRLAGDVRRQPGRRRGRAALLSRPGGQGRSPKHGSIAWTIPDRHRPGQSARMCASRRPPASRPPRTLASGLAGRGEARVRAYLEAAGLKTPPRASWRREIVAGCAAQRPTPGRGRGGARRPAGRAPAADRAGAARRRAGSGGLLAPRDQPLSIRRRAFRSLIDWRLATSRLRRLLPARAPQRVRRQPERSRRGRALTARARVRRAVFTILILATDDLGRRQLRRDPGRGRPELSRPHPHRRVRRSCCCGCRSRSGRWPPVPP